MALGTYSDLQAAIATWLGATGDAEVTGNAADFVTLAEQRINYGAEGSYPSPALRLQAMETVEPTFAVTAEYTDLPADFLEMRRLVLPSSPPWLVQLVSEEQLVALHGAATGNAYVCAVVGQQLQVKPVVTVPTNFELTYVAKVPALSVSAPTNWLLTNAPGIYLYAALLEAVGIGVAEAGMAATWYAAYQAAASGLQASDKRSRWAGSTLQMRPAMVTP
jgi:hypothetical protein